MKKIVSILLLIAICACMSACGQTEADKAKWDDAASALKEAAGTNCNVNVEKHAYVSATVDIPDSDDFARFGTRAYNIINAAREVFADENGFSVRINKETPIKKYQDKGFVYIIATDSDKVFCQYFDNRDETLPYNRDVQCKTPEDLAKFFPDLEIRLKTEKVLSQEELVIWDAVWAKLDAEPNKAEEEVYKEMAPSYGMSPDELSTFIRDCMGKIYG